MFAGNIGPESFAYGENIGWINFNPSFGDGITVTDTTVSGMAWGENIGWINLSPTNGGVVNDKAGHLSGFAWGENVGWVNFAPTGGGVTIDGATGMFGGFAWGENVGWINFAPTGAGVTTSWRPPVSLVITWATPADITYPTPLGASQLDATANVPGTFVYTPAAGTELNAGPGQILHVDFTPSDTSVKPASAEVKINVLQANQTIAFGPLGGKTYGDADFTVSATASSGLAVTFSASEPCAISGSSVHLTGAGSCTVTAQQAGNANYTAAPDVPQSFSIAKALPILTWANPADIEYGTALSETQLNATASVPGAFAYTPPAGTVLNLGANQTLTGIAAKLISLG